jgi:hypothetical protein
MHTFGHPLNTDWILMLSEINGCSFLTAFAAVEEPATSSAPMARSSVQPLSTRAW